MWRAAAELIGNETHARAKPPHGPAPPTAESLAPVKRGRRYTQKDHEITLSNSAEPHGLQRQAEALAEVVSARRDVVYWFAVVQKAEGGADSQFFGDRKFEC